MTKTEIRKEIRNWVRDIVPTLCGEYTIRQICDIFRSLYNNNEMWDTIGTTTGIGDTMVRFECARYVNRMNGGYKKARGVYVFI